MAGWSTGRGRETGGLLSVWVCLCVEWGAEEGRGGVIRTRGWGWEGVKKKKKKTTKKTDKECQALKTGMLQLYACHLATSPPHHLPPCFPISRCAL